MRIKKILFQIIVGICLLGLMMVEPCLANDNISINNEKTQFVEDIYIPIGTGSSNNIENYQFEKNQLEYDITLSDSRNIGGFHLVVDWSTINEALSEDTELYVVTYYDGVLAEKKKIVSENTALGMPTGFSTKKVPVGKTTVYEIEVGLYNAEKNNFDKSEKYTYNITRSLSLKSLTVSDETDICLAVTSFVLEPYKFLYPVVSDGKTLTVQAFPTTDSVDIFIGDSLLDNNSLEIKLEDYKEESKKIIKIPITLKYKDLETVYYLVVSDVDYTPIIKNQPNETTVEKNDPMPLQVGVDGKNIENLQYQWCYGVSCWEIKGANQQEYQPNTQYAGTQMYCCKVKNTVDGVEYSTYSDMVNYTVNLTYLTAPEFTIQPYVPQKINGGKNLFLIGQKPSVIMGADGTIERPLEGVPYEYKVYKTDKNSSIGGEDITDKCKISTSGTHNGAQEYVVELPAEDTPGIWYYYFKVVVSKNGFEDASNVSDPIKIIYKDASSVVNQLEGAGTSSDPFLINDLYDLQYVKSIVEGIDGSPFAFAGMTLKLTNDIILPSDWEPIGCLKKGTVSEESGINILPFSGVFDGDGYTISIEDGGKPLFNYVRKATVKNLNIYGTHINGYGLVDKYVVDYGADGHYINDSELMKVIDISHVTIKSGSKILRSGLIGGYASGANAINIKNCIVENGVVIGDDGSFGDLGNTEYSYPYIMGGFDHTDMIGSFAGAFNGTITNCTSAATVYGRQNVGGLIGMKGQSMGKCDLVNSSFTGTIIATGDGIGGLAGAGYIAGTASGSPMIKIQNCYVDADITGHDKVGGLVGSEEGHFNNNEQGDEFGIKGVLTMSDSFFYGTIHSSGSYVGGIAGCFHDFTKKSGEATNYYREGCGASRGIGGVLEGEIIGGEKHSISKTADEFANGTVCSLLNESPTSLQNWEQGDKYPVIGNKAIITGLEVAGEYKNEYYLGDELDLSGMTVTAEWSDGNKTSVLLEDLEIAGFDSSVRGLQEITLSFGPVSTTINVTVLKRPDPEKTEIEVSFELLGDMIHNSDEDGDVHCLSLNNLEPWIEATTYTVDVNATVKDVFELALEEYGMEWRNPTGNYIEAIFKDGEELAEFTNGVNSGWMYTLNGTHPNLGVSEQYLEDGDVIVWHYTDDYLQEEWHFQHELEKVEKKAATCTENGWEAYDTCSKCDYTTYIEIPALGHDYKVTKIAKDATCTEAGNAEETTCTRCNDVQGGEEIPALGHDYKVTKIAKDATCTEAGNKEEKTCETCAKVIGGETIEALGHTEEVIIAKEATCTEEGKTAETICSVCKEVLVNSEVIPALGHDYKVTKIAKDATCTEAGNAEETTCTRCNDVQGGEEIPALGHSYKVTKEAKDATCTEAGNTEEKTCETCGKVKGGETIEALGHKSKTVVTKATMKANGKKVVKCSRCNEKLKTTTIYAAKTVKLATAKYAYNGKKKTPTVVVKNSKGKALVKGTDYTVSMEKGRIKVGYYKITVKGKGSYSFTKSLTLTIKPKPTEIVKVTPGKKSFTVKWKKRTIQVTGYEIQYSKDSKFKTGNRAAGIKSNKTTSRICKKLKSNTTYYVRVRTYKNVNGKKIYSVWSAKKKIVTK